jgi:hypothetical protein
MNGKACKEACKENSDEETWSFAPTCRNRDPTVNARAAVCRAGVAASIDPADKHARSSQTGWQNWAPTHGGGVTVAPNGANGYLTGFVWAENIGWIHFKNAAPAYNVRTTVFDVLPSVWSGSGFKFK